MSKVSEIIEKSLRLNSHINEHLDEIDTELRDLNVLPSGTLDDQMKFDFLLENWEKITLEKLESLVK